MFPGMDAGFPLLQDSQKNTLDVSLLSHIKVSQFVPKESFGSRIKYVSILDTLKNLTCAKSPIIKLS